MVSISRRYSDKKFHKSDRGVKMCGEKCSAIFFVYFAHAVPRNQTRSAKVSNCKEDDRAGLF